MRADSNIRILNREYIEVFSEIFPPECYQRETAIIYAGHVPQVGYLLIKGLILGRRGIKKYSRYRIGALVGVRELIFSIPFDCPVTIKARSQVCILGKSSILEILESPNHKLYKVLRDILENKLMA